MLAEYDQHGRTSTATRGDEGAAAAAPPALVAGDTDTLLMAANYALRRELNRRIRDDLITVGIVQDGPAVTIADGTGPARGPRPAPATTTAPRSARPAGRWRMVTCSASRRSPKTGCSSAGPWTPTRPPGSAAGPTDTSCSKLKDAELGYAVTDHAAQGRTVTAGRP